MVNNKFFIFFLRILKLDISYFAKGSFWAMIQQIVGVSCGLVVSYFLGHYLSKAVFGEYNLILSYLGMLTFLSLPGIDLGLTQSISQGYDASFPQSQKLKFVFSLLGLPILLGISYYYYQIHQFSLSQGLLIAAILFPLLNPFTNYPAFLTGKRKFSALSFLSIGASIFFMIILSGTVIIFPKTPYLVAAYMLAVIIPSFAGFWYSLNHMKNVSTDHNLPKYGTFLTALSVISWISGNLGNIILANYVGIESLAIYSVANRFFTAVQKNFVVFYKPITAKLSIQSSQEHVLTLRQHAWKFVLIGCALMAGLWLVTPFLITVFFGNKYFEAIWFGRLLSFGLIPLPLSWVINDMLIYQKRPKPQIIAATIPQVIKIFLMFIIIPKFQISGLILIIILERYADLIIPIFSILKHDHRN